MALSVDFEQAFLLPLSGVKQTYLGHRKSVAHDPTLSGFTGIDGLFRFRADGTN